MSVLQIEQRWSVTQSESGWRCIATVAQGPVGAMGAPGRDGFHIRRLGSTTQLPFGNTAADGKLHFDFIDEYIQLSDFQDADGEIQQSGLFEQISGTVGYLLIYDTVSPNADYVMMQVAWDADEDRIMYGTVQPDTWSGIGPTIAAGHSLAGVTYGVTFLLRGPAGAAGPNQVTTSTSTNITGLLRGNGSVVSAVPGSSVASNGAITLAPTGATPQDAIVFQVGGMDAGDRHAAVRLANSAGGDSRLSFRVGNTIGGSTEVFYIHSNLSLAMRSPFSTFGGGTSFGDHYMRRGGGQQYWLGTVVDEDTFHFEGRGNTSGWFRVSARTSTTDSTPIYQTLFDWQVNTHAVRRGQATEYVWDTSRRKTRRLFTDGSRGYTAFTVHTTAPADADLQAGEMVPYLDGSGHLWCKIKDSGGTVYTRQLS